ncbi:GntR family transcriptional regulator [Aestuariivita sp.]|jgi:GntR family transcriptional regulator|uniref:GntR family transcriptional regulator n=1 Tax=Aestuariivita sp. TaxID=1872407 RepID=UPI002171025C|nr:GntR family transcriptional regulator [Aestuariivita sp.]MCE8009538.1 GntR family transcriptional regulator [Aestuariivita sp.]
MFDPTPMYHRIYVVLHDQIQRGYFDPDQPMPSEVELARTFSVSRVTLRKTLERLEREGLILRQRGRGTFARPRRVASPVQADVSGLVENLLIMGVTTKVKVIEFDYVETPSDVARDMGFDEGTLAQYAVRVRSYKKQPFSYSQTYVREDIGRSFTAKDMAKTPLLRLFERAGVKIGGANQKISARAADAVVADHLGVNIGSPLLCIKRIVKDENDRTVEWINALYHPDMYEFEMNLSLRQGPNGTVWQPSQSSL